MDKDTLAEVFANQAEWREKKASEFPDDSRNIEAAEHLCMLAETARTVDQSLLTAAEELYEDTRDVEVWNEMLRQEGFNTYHQSAEAFLKGFISQRSSGM